MGNLNLKPCFFILQPSQEYALLPLHSNKSYRRPLVVVVAAVVAVAVVVAVVVVVVAAAVVVGGGDEGGGDIGLEEVANSVHETHFHEGLEVVAGAARACTQIVTVDVMSVSCGGVADVAVAVDNVAVDAVGGGAAAGIVWGWGSYRYSPKTCHLPGTQAGGKNHCHKMNSSLTRLCYT